MRYAIILLVFAAAMTAAGTLLSQNEGYVEIGLTNGTYKMPLWYFIVALVVLIVASIIAFKILATIISIPGLTKRFGKKRRAYKANELLQKGMLAMGKGQWKKAEKILVKGARLSHNANNDPSLFLSTAAQAAQNLGAEERRDQYLLEARQLSVEGIDTITTALSEASIHLDEKQPEKALAVLQPHRTSHYSNPKLIQIESEAHAQLDRYDEVWQLLPSLKKYLPSKQAYEERQEEVAKALFASPNSSLESIEKAWSELSKSSRKDEGVLLNFISALIYRDEEERAEKMLSSMIKTDYSDPLIHAYTQLDIGSSNDRLRKVQHWLKSHPDNAYLNYGAAKFAYQSEQLPLAKDYAEKSIKELAMPETLALLGKIYEALGESSSALQAYKGSIGLIYTDNAPLVEGDVLPQANHEMLPQMDEKTVVEAEDSNHQDTEKEDTQQRTSAEV